MEITLTLDYGTLDAEFSGKNREELQDELIEFVEFIGEEKETLSNLPAPEENTMSGDGGTQAPLSGWEDSSQSQTSQESDDVSTEFVSLSTKTGVDEGTLEQFFELPDNGEGVPNLNMYHFEDGVLTLGSARNQRQAQASTLLLYVWEECLDEKRIDYERLNQALVSSDVETERRDAMGQAFSNDASDWFESDGSNIYLVGKGKNHARNLIQELDKKLDR